MAGTLYPRGDFIRTGCRSTHLLGCLEMFQRCSDLLNFTLFIKDDGHIPRKKICSDSDNSKYFQYPVGLDFCRRLTLRKPDIKTLAPHEDYMFGYSEEELEDAL